MALLHSSGTTTYAKLRSLVYPMMAVTTDATAGVKTYTAAEILGGLILRDANGAARSDVMPSASALVAYILGCEVGTSFEFTVRNTAAGAFALTMTAGAGITISGTATIAQSNSKRFVGVVTSITEGSEAVTVYSLGTVVT